MGRAQAIQYTDLNYSPREGEVRTYLTDWANYRYTISRDTIAKKYPLNYYFLSQNSRFAVDGPGQPESSCLAGRRRADRAERCGGEERHHHVHVGGDSAGRDDRSRNGACHHRQALLPAQLPGAKDGALAAECHLLPESQAGERSGPSLPAVRDDQSARIDHHRVPREPDVRRSDRAR